MKVVDRSATQGVRNVAVVATSPAYSPPQAATDLNGCVVFKDIPVGTYTITLNTTGYLDRDGNTLSKVTANVVAKKVVFATMSYDVADEVHVDVLTHTPGKAWSAALATERQPSKARRVSTMNGANVGMVRTATPASPATTVTMTGLFPFAENSYAFFTGGCKYMSPDQVATTASSTKLWPNYFNTNGGVNPAAAVLADPDIANQRATVRQPPFNIRVGSTRNGATFTDGQMVVYATLQKPNGTSTDTCAEAPYVPPTSALTTMNWDAVRFGGRGTNGSGDNHWVTQGGTTFDPGMPFGTYTICLRDTNLNRSVSLGNYDNTHPDGGPLWQVGYSGGNSNVTRATATGNVTSTISWTSGNIC